MTVTIREGEPGAGKTISSVGEDILPALKQRRRVVTNIDLKLDEITELLGFDVEPYVIVKPQEENDEQGRPWFSHVDHYREHEKWRSEGDTGFSALIVVDEAHEVLRVEGFAGKADTGIVNWFAMHRHKGVDVVLLSQGFGEIPASIRRRTAKRYWYRKLAFLGMPGRYVKHTFVGQNKKPARTEYGKYPRQWMGLYRSVDEGVVESIPKEKNVLLNWKLLAFTALLLGLVVVFFGSGGPQFGFRPSNTEADKASASAAQPGSTLATSSAVEDGPRVVSKGPFGSQQVVEPSKALIDLQDAIAVLRAQHELDALKFKRPSHDELDGMSARISGYMMVSGQATYFVEVAGNGKRARVINADDLAQFGFKVTAIDRCAAVLRGDRGVYRLTCDVPARFGKPNDEFLPGRVQPAKLTRSTSVEEPSDIQEPVPATEGRLAP